MNNSMETSLDTEPDYIKKCPIVFHWVEYLEGGKWVKYFASIDYQKSIKAHRAILDLHYCVTKALNGIVIKSVNYDPSKFNLIDTTLI